MMSCTSNSAGRPSRMLPPRNTGSFRMCGADNMYAGSRSSIRPRNYSRRSVCLGIWVWISVCISIVSLVSAQPAGSSAASDKEIKIDAPRVDWSHAIEVHRQIESWIAARRTGGADDKPIEVTGLSGVKVTLRWNGKVLGSGEAYPDDPTAENAVVNLKALAAHATQLALEASESTLQDLRRRALARPEAQPSTQPDADNKPRRDPTRYLLADPTIRLVAELQVGLRLEPIRLPADAKDAAIYEQFVPDFHGLRLWTDAGNAPASPRDSWIWPGTALAYNMSPNNQVLRLLIQARLDMNDVRKLGRPKGPSFWRFEIIHVVRPSPDSAVTRLVRGNVLLPLTSLDEATLDAMALRMADNLSGRFVEKLPLPNAEQNERATEDLALTAYVLSQWLRQSDKASLPEKIRTQAEAVVKRNTEILLASMTQLKGVPQALLLLTMIDSPMLNERKVQRDSLANSLLRHWNADGSFTTGDSTGKEPAGGVKKGNDTASAQALIVSALARLYEQTRDVELGRKVQTARLMQWREFSADRIIAALPWMMRTENSGTLLDAIPGPVAGDAKQTTQRQEKIKKLMAALRERQIMDPPDMGPSDVVGGFELNGWPPVGAPNPDWRSSLVVSFLASAMRDPAIVKPADRLSWLLTCGLGARFLAQLMYDTPNAYYVQFPSEAIGATRVSLWDNDTPSSVTAMSLLAVLDLKKTIAEIQAAGGFSPTTPD